MTRTCDGVILDLKNFLKQQKCSVFKTSIDSYCYVITYQNRSVNFFKLKTDNR
jgi:hypothetical protein